MKYSRGDYLFVAALLALTLTPSGAPARARQTTTNAVRAATSPSGNPQDGRKAFIAHTCYTCHGYEAEGGVGLRLVGYSNTLDSFIAYVRQPRGVMPPAGANITAQEFLDIYTWVRSIAPSPDAKTIDLLKPDAK
jgi:mono/diheme cytochrome c family protein